ncbi:UDP-glucuronosyl/UDP-glucosyltransferase [Sesbania bispinosa]|nr:UDP-glucuronosyl/UDP-glucosyltransferase [Sesbania bispinosa]
MDSYETKKAHVVCVPFPLQGHVNPLMQLAKLLHCNGFHITFVNSEFNHERLVQSQGTDFVNDIPGFRFETIPDGLPPSDLNKSQDIPALSDSTRMHCYTPFKELVCKLNSLADLPKVSCIISDGITSFAVKVVNDLGIPVVQFSTGSACGFFGFLQFEELVKRGIVPFKDENFIVDGSLDATVDWVPGMKNIRLKDLPNFIRVTNLDDQQFEFVGSEAQNCWRSSGIIINTFQELESEALDFIMTKNPNVYSIGPLSLLGRHFMEKEYKSPYSSLWKNDSKCIHWLDQWAPTSVIYVNYGSIAVMTREHFIEFAWGLANSKLPFLWIVRKDGVMGESVNLPEEFLDEVKDRGYITSWCPQVQVLAHPSIGVFVTHCHCGFACIKWGIGMEMSHDVKREEIASLVKEVLEGEKGMGMRSRMEDESIESY